MLKIAEAKKRKGSEDSSSDSAVPAKRARPRENRKRKREKEEKEEQSEVTVRYDEAGIAQFPLDNLFDPTLRWSHLLLLHSTAGKSPLKTGVPLSFRIGDTDTVKITWYPLPGTETVYYAMSRLDDAYIMVILNNHLVREKRSKFQLLRRNAFQLPCDINVANK